MIEELKNVFRLKKVTLIDFARMDVDKLSQILAKFGVMNPDDVARGMIDEAKIWKNFLEKL